MEIWKAFPFSFYRPKTVPGKEDLGPHVYTVRNWSYIAFTHAFMVTSRSPSGCSFTNECGSAYGGRPHKLAPIHIPNPAISRPRVSSWRTLNLLNPLPGLSSLLWQYTSHLRTHWALVPFFFLFVQPIQRSMRKNIKKRNHIRTCLERKEKKGAGFSVCSQMCTCVCCLHVN